MEGTQVKVDFGTKVTVYGRYRGVVVSGTAAHPDVFPCRVAVEKEIWTESGLQKEFFVRHDEFKLGWG